ncbi:MULTISPECIES: TetR/AcrR family transcriptional regulator [Paenibacillus]|uniref:TetR/AcrR family transcriptional regulator n=1 Tax=Paenibacillus TaxID=44249 RepID=UPI00040C4977|nr:MULTISPECIES: TetR/AcrR family transcriptional regulator [Paenibacillus]KGP79874.1 hypothetical protein P364_0120700 [Paenibacillus sp. MAEPY2]KGP87073.1 hypothetical protein P363_0114145 [Paenibacillus sp. MAEPY1]OZQ58861.1 TetR family transcriptional regulator [Paenibacillus taichungensis]HBU83328.1 TetR/AcrR family transcriptional regulator [Paenibacillus sp.]
MRSNSKRKDLLAAASFIVDHNGMDKLTLEAVASQAGVSKGGLLHHFPNKDALIKAMIDEYTDAFIQSMKEKVDEDPVSRGKWHRAYLESTILDINSSNKVISAYKAALFTDPIMLSSFKDNLEKIYEEMRRDGLDEVTAIIIRLAIDGLWYSELFNVGNLDANMKERISERMTELINKV